MKKAFGVLLVLALVLCLSTTAFAAEAVTEEIYENKIKPEEFELVINEGEGEKLVEMDVVANEYKVVEVDGYYYLGNEWGPKILVNLSDELCSISEMFTMSTPIYEVKEDGTWVTDNGKPVYHEKIDFTAARDAYIACADGGYYPLTTDLAYMIQTYGLNQGWWGKVVDPNFAWPIFYEDAGEDVWLYACSYVQSCDHANAEEYAAQEPTCHDEGWSQYWYCPDCNTYFADASCTIVNTRYLLPATGSENVQHYDAVKPSCHDNGNIEYWYCPDCDRYFVDEAQTQISNALSVVLPAIGCENVVHYEALEPTCHQEGWVEHWYCPDCDTYYADANCLIPESQLRFMRAPLGSENIIHYEAVESTCHDFGNIEYWYCPDCDGYWTDEALTKTTNSLSVVLPVKGSENVIHYEALEPTCHQEGWIEHWYCPDCETYYADANCRIPESQLRFMRAPLGSENVVHYEALEPTCHQEGWGEHWYCPDCDTRYADAECHIVDTRYLRPATGSDKVEHIAAKAPTATENGNIEYWHCADCDGYWTDEALTQISNVKRVILPASDPIPATSDSFQFAVIALAILSVSGVACLLVSKKRFF